MRAREEALDWRSVTESFGDRELETGKVDEPWDIGVVPEPPNAPLQVLLIEKATP